MDRFEALSAFVAVADLRGFAAAARALGTSPPAITRAVAALERHLGVTLFHRSTRAVSLTDEGAALLDRTRRILADLRETVFAHITRLSSSFFDQAKTGELVSRLAADTTQMKSAVGASVSIALRNLVLFIWGADAHYYSEELQISLEVLPNVRLMPDQVLVLVLTVALVVGLHLFLKYSRIGIAMRSMAENPALSQVCGIDIAKVVRWTWMLSGALAAIAGVFAGLTVQIRPEMGFSMLLALFTAAILGGTGSLFGAVAGGLIVGLTESLSTLIIPTGYKAAVPFGLLLIILFLRPQGLFSRSARA